MVLMEVRQLSVPGRLADLSLTLESGTVTGLIGPNGAGKSTLLQALAGTLPYEGTVVLDRHSIRHLRPTERARQIGLLPQQQHSAWALKVADVVTLGRLPWGDQDTKAIGEAINGTDIRSLLDRRIDTLSGGQQARVWLARVLAGTPRILLADEPLASLDIAFQRQIMSLLRDYAAQGHAVLVSLHDLSMAARYCEQLVLLNEGRLVASGEPCQVLTPDRLKQVFRVEAHVDFAARPPIISLY